MKKEAVGGNVVRKIKTKGSRSRRGCKGPQKKGRQVQETSVKTVWLEKKKMPHIRNDAEKKVRKGGGCQLRWEKVATLCGDSETGERKL